MENEEEDREGNRPDHVNERREQHDGRHDTLRDVRQRSEEIVELNQRDEAGPDQGKKGGIFERHARLWTIGPQ